MKNFLTRSHTWPKVQLTALITFVVAGLLTLASAPGVAADSAEQEALVNQARITLDNFLADPDQTGFRANVKQAKGLLIVPDLLKGGLIIGGSGGDGVLLVRDNKTGEWSEPAFYTVGGASIGLQVGVQSSEVMLLVMTDKGLESLYSSSDFKLGGDASVAIGSHGEGVEGSSTADLQSDYLSFSRSEGLFAGLSLEGSSINFSDDANMAYYGKSTTPRNIIVTGDVSNPKSEELQNAVKKITK